MEWISCKDRMPEYGEQVLVWDKTAIIKFYPAIYMPYKGEEKIGLFSIGMSYAFNVTYWMPIIEPPSK